MRQVAAEHHGATECVGGQAGGAGHAFDHERVQGALAELAHDQAKQEVTLVLSESRHEGPKQPPACGSRALAAGASDLFQRGVDVRELDAAGRRPAFGVGKQRRVVGRYSRTVGILPVRRRLQCRPTDAQLLLPNRTREVGGRELDLIGRRGRE